MSRINTNVPAQKAIFQFQRNNADLSVALQRLSTGLRINRGGDDPAGLIVSERLRSEARGLQQAVANTVRAKNVISTAEGALNEVSALLLSAQALVVRTSNEAGLTEEEVRANQLEIDSILSSIDRIAETTRFGQEPLLNGERSYTLSAVSNAAFGSVSVFGAHVPFRGTRDVRVQVLQSAQTAELRFIGSNTSGPSTTSATTIQVQGNKGSEIISLVAGSTLDVIRDAINAVTALTGVSAVVSSTGTPGIASSITFNSIGVGSDSYVSVTPLGGNFVVQGNQNIEQRDNGEEASVLIDNQQAQVDGLRAFVRTSDLDTRIILTREFIQTLSSSTFSITGGGSIFQVTPELKPSGQGRLGLGSVSSTHLGDEVSGLLHTLRSGQNNELSTLNFSTAQEIVNEAIDQVASYRARLGSFQRNLLDPTLNAQSIAFENVTASESVIRDADIAVEVSNLTRAQILVQSTQSVLQIANSVPTQVLGLLQ